MRILMISTDRKIFELGSEVRERIIEYGSLAEELRVTVFAPKDQEYSEERVADNVWVYPTQSKNKWFYVSDAVKTGYRLIKESGSKNGLLITAQDPFECGLAGFCLAKWFRLPIQLQIHTDLFSEYFWEESLLNKVRVITARLLLPRAGCLRTASERIKNSLIKELGIAESAVSVLPIFVDINKIKKADIAADLHDKYPQFDFIMLMASRLSREKNVPLAIDAMRYIASKRPKTGLVIVGDGPEKPYLELRTARLKLSKNIIFESWTDDLASYYKTADLFLLTSNYEGYGRTVIEAMAADCPVVMTDVGLARDIVVHNTNGLVVPVGDKEKLQEAILGLVVSPSKRKRLAKSASAAIFGLADKATHLARYKASWEKCF